MTSGYLQTEDTIIAMGKALANVECLDLIDFVTLALRKTGKWTESEIRLCGHEAARRVILKRAIDKKHKMEAA